MLVKGAVGDIWGSPYQLRSSIDIYQIFIILYQAFVIIVAILMSSISWQFWRFECNLYQNSLKCARQVEQGIINYM